MKSFLVILYAFVFQKFIELILQIFLPIEYFLNKEAIYLYPALELI